MTDFSFPTNNQPLGTERVEFLKTFRKACSRTILEMLKTSQSGHPGGSLSMLDFLSVLYVERLTKTDEPIVVSNGHVSPAVYSVLAECGAVDRKEVVETFRQVGSYFEGHVTRHIPGIWYGTGPLGSGISAAAGMAYALKGSGKRVFGTVGDGECQEGQVHEMALYAAKEKLSNFTVFCDYNRVQLTDSLASTMPIDVSAMFAAAGWNVIEINGHDQEQLWKAICDSEQSDKPTIIVGETIMGQGVPGMQEDGEAIKSTWHGKAPKPDMIDEMLSKLELRHEETSALEAFRKDRNFTPQKTPFWDRLSQDLSVKTGTPTEYGVDELTDCRSAYGKALLDLAKSNSNILAGSADLTGSVMTKFVQAEIPQQYTEFGICEQHMVSSAGGMSLVGKIPFVSTFGAFMTSRAKDQARVNDINETNVKMVATHCGLSVGEDGPTHQAIDDMGSMVGLFNMHVIEPADPNHCDRIIRYVASHHGNFYVRMGRAKLPTLTYEDGNLVFPADYKYEYGKTETVRSGSDIVIIATGACVHEALKARKNFSNPKNVEIVIVSSIKKFDQNLIQSLKKAKHVITAEDHNPYSGLASAISQLLVNEKISIDSFTPIAVTEYQLSGTAEDLYRVAGIDSEAILKVLNSF